MERMARRRHRFSLRLPERLEERTLLASFTFAAVEMTAHEQLLLELINRARLDPEGEATRYGIDLNDGLDPGTISSAPKQPLAPNQSLIQAAGDHSQDMLDRDYFSHTSPEPDSTTFTERMAQAGYGSYTTAGENIAWGGSTGPVDPLLQVLQRHSSLFRSAGHRENILGAGFREAGTGVRLGEYRGYNACMVTELFASRSGGYFLTGAAYDDLVAANSFYNVGEGLAGVSIVATNLSTGDTYSTTTGGSGGYALRVPNGTYRIVASGGDLGADQVIESVTLSGANQKFDFIAQEAPPLADAGGPYSVAEGGEVQLDGSGSTGGSLTYEWDLDGDGVFGEADGDRGDETSATPWFSAAGLDGCPGAVFQVALRVRSGGTTSEVATVDIAIENVAPTVSISGPASAVPFQPLQFTFSAEDPSPDDVSELVTYTIDWSGDGADVQVISGPASGLTVWHSFATIGDHSVSVSAEDRDGETGDVQSHLVAVSQSLLVDGSLFVGGTADADRLYFYQTGANQFQYRLGGISPNLTVTGTITAFGGPGNDLVVMDETSTVSVVIYGGDGADRLYGGAGPDQIFGEAGRDVIEGRPGHDLLDGGDADDFLRGNMGHDRLYGGAGHDQMRGDIGNDILRGDGGRDSLRGDDGNDVLIGGDGADRLDAVIGRDIVIGGAANDSLVGADGGALLIGGASRYDLASAANDAALAALSAEWSSSRSLATRTANITGRGSGPRANGAHFLLLSEMSDDGAWDYLYGGEGEDLYFVISRLDLIATDAVGDLVES